MKTTPFILVLLVLVSCAKPPPPGFTSWDNTVTPKSTAPVAPPPPAPPVKESHVVIQTNHVAHTDVTTAVTPAATEPVPPSITPAIEAAPADAVDTNGPAASPFARTAQPAVPPITRGGTGATLPAPGQTAVEPAPLAGAAMAPPSAMGGDQIVPAGMIDFRNTPLDQVLQVYGEFVNRTILRPAALPTPQVTLTIRNPLTRNEVIQALDAVLALNGISLFNVGDKFVKVVPQAQVHTEGAPADPREYWRLPDLGQYVTHVVQLKYLKPSETVPILQPFAKLNSILPMDNSGILVIRDYTENVKRMLEMIDRIDIAVPSEFISEVIPIKYAKASEIADALNSLSGGGGGSTSVGRAAGTQTRGATPGNTARPGQQGYNTNPNNPMGQSGVGGAGGAGGAGGTFSDRLNAIIRRASTSGDLEILGKTKMIADERSNSLLIFASRADMEMIKNVVAKLDVVLSQVLIETVIMDVQMGNNLSYGVSASQDPMPLGKNGTGAGAFVNGSGNLSALKDLFSGGGNSNVFSSGLNYFGRYTGKNGNVDVAVQALASDSRVNVIQKPRILTSHATPGSIFIGGTIPYVTSTYYGGGFGGSPSSQYQQLQVGIGLTVTPYINPDGLVVMQIDETIDELSDQVTAIVGVGNVPNTVSRKLSAEVAVRDGDTIMLGGFIRNSVSKSSSGVPLLKDIPLLGVLFSARSNDKDRTELLVLMRPTVLKTPEVAALATVQEKKRLPGVSEAEAEIDEMEKTYLKREENRQLRNRTPNH